MFKLYEDGAFSHLNRDYLEDSLATVRSMRGLRLIIQASKDQDFLKAIAHCDTWMAMQAPQLRSNLRSHDVVISMKEGC